MNGAHLRRRGGALRHPQPAASASLAGQDNQSGMRTVQSYGLQSTDRVKDGSCPIEA